MQTIENQTVAAVTWDIVMRPHHRARWEPWNRPHRMTKTTGHEAAQTSIGWVVDDYRYGDVKEQWKESGSSPSTRSALQRLFSQGARSVPNATDNMPFKQLTRSRILTDLVAAFGIEGDELDEIRSAFRSRPVSGGAHMGPAFHTWDVVQGDDDLRAVVQLSRQVIGGHAGFKADATQVPNEGDIASLRERSNIRPDAIDLCVRNEIEGDQDTLVGYMLAYPVDAEAAGGLLSGTITNAADIVLENIASRAVDEDALYVGMVLGSDLSARATVMDQCLHRCSAWAARHPNGHIFAKRATDDGERWLHNYGFVPVTDKDHIWVRRCSAPLARPRRRRLVPAAV